MSEPVEKRRPMIDLDEFERRLRLQFNADAPSEPPVTEFSGIVDGRDFYGRGRLRPQLQDAPSVSSHEISAKDFQIGGDFAAIEAGLLGLIEPGSDAPRPLSHDAGAGPFQAHPPLRAIRGDFSEIEAGLLGGANEPMFAAGRSGEGTPPEGAAVKPLAGLDPSERYVIAGGLPDHAGAEEETRSRRTLYIMAAIVVIGLGGIAAKFQSGFSGGLQPLEMKAETSPETARAQTATAERSAPEDSVALASQPDSSVAADAAQMASAAEAAPGTAAATAPITAAFAPANVDVATPPAQAVIEPPLSSPEAKPAATAFIEPPASPAPVMGTAPALPDVQAKPAALVKSAAAPATSSHAGAVVKAAAAKPAHAAAAPKQAAADRAKTHAQTAHAAIKPKPVAHASGEHPAQTAEAPPEQTAPAPAQAANPAATGVSSIMQMAVNSVNNAVKMLDWRR